MKKNRCLVVGGVVVSSVLLVVILELQYSDNVTEFSIEIAEIRLLVLCSPNTKYFQITHITHSVITELYLLLSTEATEKPTCKRYPCHLGIFNWCYILLNSPKKEGQWKKFFLKIHNKRIWWINLLKESYWKFYSVSVCVLVRVVYLLICDVHLLLVSSR